MIEHIFRCLRGGAWYVSPPYMSAPYRDRIGPDYRSYVYGFRLVVRIKDE